MFLRKAFRVPSQILRTYVKVVQKGLILLFNSVFDFKFSFWIKKISRLLQSYVFAQSISSSLPDFEELKKVVSFWAVGGSSFSLKKVTSLTFKENEDQKPKSYKTLMPVVYKFDWKASVFDSTKHLQPSKMFASYACGYLMISPCVNQT